MTVDAIIEALTTQHVGWIVDNGRPFLPTTLHGSGHTFEGSCAICRAGDKPEALAAVVAVVAAVLRAQADA